MILEFIAALTSGVALMGVLIIVNRLTGRRMGAWVFPAAVGLGMLSYSVWSEYSWASRVITPGASYVEVTRNHNSVWYRPWTYLWPQVNRIIALDRRYERTHPGQPHLVQARVVRLERWIPESAFIAVFDCDAGALAPMVAGVELMPDGTVEGAEWVPMPADDPMLRGACALREG
ncbi:MAG: hypothetical protein JJU15_12025 [Pararhodobacter sp.]|nr:hypothetical protein [Pararhodobacter sp.]